MEDYEKKIKKERKYFFIIIPILLIITLVGITFAFFNYTRTGASNTIKVGRISFISKNEQTITLNNLFPIDPSNTTDMNDPDKVGTYSIDIKGDTDYIDGIEYLVSATNANIYTSEGQIVPITLDMTVNSLGTPTANYFTAREDKDTLIYKKLVGDTLVGDQMLLVGYIPQNNPTGTADGVDGSITIKAYLDKNKILISDTYDGTESDPMGTTNNDAEGKTVLTTSEWNTIKTNGVSFKVKVEANEGIWVNGSLEEIMRKSAVMDNINSDYVNNTTPGINFGDISSDTNGKGVYMRAGTQNDDNPIMYYRGAVEDNNVVFNNKCWKAVRTTDTGGVKLIYNGTASANKAPLAESDYTILSNTGNFTFDSNDNTWTRIITAEDDSSGPLLEITFNVPAGDNYLIQISGVTSLTGGESVAIYKGSSQLFGNGNSNGGEISISYVLGTLTASDVIKVTSRGSGTPESPSTVKIKMIKPNEALGMGCDNSGVKSGITLNVGGTDTNRFSFAGTNMYNSLAYVGYMYGTVYTYSEENWTNNARFGSGFTWDGTNYTLIDDSLTSPNSTHHYSCNVATENGTCHELRYVYYINYNGSLKYYVTLTNGDGIEEAIEKMHTNTNDSASKDIIETWYASNMNEFTNRIEDTIYCNDRSVYDLGGWNPNGGNLKDNLYYAPYGRASTYSPSLSCTNINDAFTWKNVNGNQKLAYPVGMITSDEIILAGGKLKYPNILPNTYYLTTFNSYWSLSPGQFQESSAYNFFVDMDMGQLMPAATNIISGLRPVISIKPGQPVISGTGTVVDPYVIE